jgi:hemolysin III
LEWAGWSCGDPAACEAVSLSTLIWLIAGGWSTRRRVVFHQDHKRYRHFIWHLFVLGGTSCHYFAVLTYAT